MRERNEIELQCVREKLKSTEAKASSEVSSLRGVATSLESSLRRSNECVQALTERYGECVKVTGLVDFHSTDQHQLV